MTNEDYVSLEVAKKLKEKGFDYSTLYYYEKNGKLGMMSLDAQSQMRNHGYMKDVYPCPTLYEAQKWLRENHLIHITILCDWDKAESYSYYLSVCDNDNNVDIKPYTRYSDYNECINAALVKALNRI